jgi:hypothetical protein
MPDPKKKEAAGPKTRPDTSSFKRIVRTALFLSASTALSSGFLIGAASTGFGAASATAFLLLLSTTGTRFGTASGAAGFLIGWLGADRPRLFTASPALAIGGAENRAGPGNQSGQAQASQDFFQLGRFHKFHLLFWGSL